MGYEVDYNENNKRPLTHYIKNFLVGFLLIVILLLLLVWIFPTNSSIQKLLNSNKEETEEFSNYFQENINLLKDIAESYFTLERLPQNEGDKVKITLGEMLEKKLLVNLSDDKGKMCSTDNTYVEVTKKKTEYEMKIYLSCGDDEDYVIVYLGCYDYCSNYVCEKKTTTTTASKTSTTKTTTTVTPTTKYYCKVVKNKYYDNKGNVVTKAAYEKACKNTTPTTKYYCKVVNNKYYDNKGNSVTKTAYEKACKKYQYLYEKKVEAIYSDWSDWSKDKEYDPNNNNITWGKQELVWNEKYGYANVTVNKKQYVNDTTKPIFGKAELVKTSLTSKKWTCKNYYYYINQTSGGTLYQASSWTYQGKVQLTYVPTNTDTVKYEYVGFDFDACASNCTLKPVYLFKKYTRTVKNVTTKSKSTLQAECAELEETEVPIYTQVSRLIGYEQKTVTTSTTKKVYYYHTKTRTLKSKAQTYKVWSNSSNDTKLIKQGYKYTGTKQEIK
jgi:hypothetical protein